ncbi:hypothetical protein QZM82_31775 [Burkholderia cepacia]|uniref:hypothetical protein n=1 Tax=Burkholderia cepacia TaxID=292 RepID=UPI0026511609|nr:hypothetical protein [Burkholderia cepacia]MDN7900779.1 hypothetical protein [Burkholderia cepacia]
MIRTASIVLLATAVTLPVFATASMAAEADVRPAPLMGLPIMTGLSRVRLSVVPVTTPSSSARRVVAVEHADDVVATARKTLSGNEEVLSPQ